MNFEKAFEILLKHEGGFVNHAADPGGATRYGITEAVARKSGYAGDMKDLPVSIAKHIYKNLYWDTIRADELPGQIRYLVFDAAVNSGAAQSIKWLQRSIGAEDDGKLGPITMRMVQDCNPDKLARVLLATRLRFMAGLSTWPAFGRGWARRIADLLEM